ncbi:MAG: hypothetical protein OJF50_002266 [Nitrospira sp.]|nr:hypothetical protein [Nitrospira sp.]
MFASGDWMGDGTRLMGELTQRALQIALHRHQPKLGLPTIPIAAVSIRRRLIHDGS